MGSLHQEQFNKQILCLLDLLRIEWLGNAVLVAGKHLILPNVSIY